MARSTVAHEYQHHLDLMSFDKSRNSSIITKTELKAYTVELKQMNKNKLSLHEWKISVNGAFKEHAPWYSYIGFYLPLIIRSIY